MYHSVCTCVCNYVNHALSLETSPDLSSASDKNYFYVQQGLVIGVQTSSGAATSNVQKQHSDQGFCASVSCDLVSMLAVILTIACKGETFQPLRIELEGFATDSSNAYNQFIIAKRTAYLHAACSPGYLVSSA